MESPCFGGGNRLELPRPIALRPLAHGGFSGDEQSSIPRRPGAVRRPLIRL
jgi:hypothetical protein